MVGARRARNDDAVGISKNIIGCPRIHQDLPVLRCYRFFQFLGPFCLSRNPHTWHKQDPLFVWLEHENGLIIEGCFIGIVFSV